ncbi:MAG: hypothetical protein A2170_16790 [Deltaproteobacteria bacterium RBG_13_53_10]|nr:MAG: hypothetical protein A2170_16790 [Deltaproteobacteria bacterium RBG_13_53_10]
MKPYRTFIEQNPYQFLHRLEKPGEERQEGAVKVNLLWDKSLETLKKMRRAVKEKILIRQTKAGHNPLKSRGDVIYPDSETERNRVEQSWGVCFFMFPTWSKIVTPGQWRSRTVHTP